MKKRVLLAFMIAVVMNATACSDRGEGTLEKIGRETDDAISDITEPRSTQEKIGDSIKDLGDKIEDGA